MYHTMSWRIRIKLLIASFVLCLSAQAWSQSYLPLEHVGEKDGLSFRRVKQIYQDNIGFMWFCTANGLNRYDGKEWKVYQNIEGDSTSIPGNVANWVFEDGEGNLIIDNSDDRPLYSYFDRMKGTFQQLKIINYHRENELVLRGPFQTKTGEIIAIGKLVKLNKHYNAYETNPESYLLHYMGNGTFVFGKQLTYSIAPPPVTINPTSSSERFWSISIGKYEEVDLQNKTLTRYNTSGFGKYGVPIDNKGMFWYPDLDPNSEQKFQKFQVPPQIPLEDWESYRTDNLGNVWLREKNNQLFKYDISLKTINPEGEFEMKYFDDKPIFQDKNDILWIPSHFGVNKIRKKSEYFDHYLKGNFEFDNVAQEKKEEQIEKGFVIYSIVETSDDKLMALTTLNQLYTIDREENKGYLEHIVRGEEGVFLKITGSLAKMLAGSNGQLWFDNGLINMYDPATKALTHYPLPDDYQKFKPVVLGEKVRSAQMDNCGKICFISGSDRLYTFDPLTKTYSLYAENAFPRGVLGIGEDQKWIATDSFLYQVDPNPILNKRFKLPQKNITSNNYELLKVVPYENKVWIGTRSGLLVFDQTREEFQQYSTVDGLPNNIIYNIIPNGNDLWLGTHHGLCRFNISSKEIRNYYTADGLTHNEFNRKSAFKGKDGKLYFGGMNGINSFYPEILDSLTRLEASNLIWTGFNKLDGKTDKITIYKEDMLQVNEALEINYGDKSYSFQFALLNFIEPTENTYSYYLEGFERDWNFAENSSFANYPSLPPGSYNLRVKAKDSRGNIGYNELSIPIIVYNAWWRTQWSKGVFLFLLISGFYAYYRWRTKSLKKQKIVLEQTVKDRTIQLEAQKERAEQSEKYKEQFLANMSHEIRTPMHAISGMVKILKRNDHLPSQDTYLNAMRASSDNLVVILNDVLDLSKIEAGKLDIESIPISPNSILDNVTQILKFKAEEKGISLNYKIGNNVPDLIMGDPTRLNQILINLIGNAIKFTEKGSVDVMLTRVKDRLLYTIRDTGIGIQEDKVNTIFEAFEQAKDNISRHYDGTGLGLSISKQLVELQDGKIWVESEEEVGSTFFFDIPLVLAAKDAMKQEFITDEILKTMTASLEGIHILIAEDNAFNQMIAQDDLSYLIKNVKIDVVENGRLAVEKFKTENYDLILMDVQMPEMNGFEASRKIRQIEKMEGRKTAIPIIAMTASLLKSEVDNCYQAGMDNYIPKPYQQEELIGPMFSEMKKA